MKPRRKRSGSRFQSPAALAAGAVLATLVLFGALSDLYLQRRLGMKPPQSSDPVGDRGFRGRGLPPAQKRTPVRILCLGDSHTYGHGVRPEEAYPSLLETRLNRRAGTQKYEVLNAGRGGSCIIEKLEVYRKSGPRLRHDSVILQVGGEDLARLALHIRDERRELGWTWRLAKRLRRRFPRSGLAETAWRRVLGKTSKEIEKLLQTEAGRPLLERAQRSFVDQVDRLYLEVRRNRADLLVLRFGFVPLDSEVEAALERSLAKGVPRLHLPEIEALPHSDSGTRTRQPDGHLSALGYRMLVERLVESLPPGALE